MKKIIFLYRAYRYRYKLDVHDIDFMISHLKKGDVGVDIGCHKGGYLYWMRKSVGLTGECFVFEPQKSLHQYLSRVIKAFNWKNVIVEDMALSSSEGPRYLRIPGTKENSPGASLEILDLDARKFPVKTSSIDIYFGNRKKIPSFIKIDVEGHELDVLKGGIQTLSMHKPILMLESEERHNKGITREVFNFLEELGYEGFFFLNGNKFAVSEFNPTIHQKNVGNRYWAKKGYVNNFIFTVKKGEES